MKKHTMLLLALPVAMLSGGCTNPPKEQPGPVVSRAAPAPIVMPEAPKPVTPGEIFVSHGEPAAEWFAEAKVLHTPERAIYYKGTLAGDLAPDGKHWTGDVKGEIFVKSPKSEMTCTDLWVGPKGELRVTGASRLSGDGFPGL